MMSHFIFKASFDKADAKLKAKESSKAEKAMSHFVENYKEREDKK